MSRLRVWSVVVAVTLLLTVLVWLGNGILRQPHAGAPGPRTAHESLAGERADDTHDVPPLLPTPSTTDVADTEPFADRADDTEPGEVGERGGPGVLVRAIWADDGSEAGEVVIEARTDKKNKNRQRRGHRRSRYQSHNIDRRTDEFGEAWFRRLEPGIWRFSSEHGVMQMVNVVADQQHELFLVLPPPEELRGVVLDEHGDPVPRARLWISGDGTGTHGSRRGRADERGRFRISHAPRGHWIGAEPEHGAFSDLRRIDDRHLREDSLELIVRTDTVARTLVRTATDSTASQVRALVWTLRSAAEERTAFAGGVSMPPPPARVRSFDSGELEFPATPRDATLRVALIAAEHAPQVVDLRPDDFQLGRPSKRRERLGLPAGHSDARQDLEILVATVKLVPSLLVHGRTHDHQDGIAGHVRVTVLERDWLLELGDTLETTSSDGGTYQLAPIATREGQWLLASGGSGRGSSVALIGRARYPDLDLIPPHRGKHEWNPHLDGLPLVHVRLTDEYGEALARWRVRLSPNDGSDRRDAPVLASNARGVVTFPGPPTRRALVELFPPGAHLDYTAVESDWIDVEDGHEGERTLTVRTER